jgi:hypothetical protein
VFSDTIILLHDTLTLLMFIGFSCCFLCLTLLDAYQVKFKYATEISKDSDAARFVERIGFYIWLKLRISSSTGILTR